MRISLTGLHYAIACYGYQSCEHSGWKGSDAEVWTSGLRATLVGHPAVFTNPTFGEHPWGYEETDVHAVGVSLVGRSR